MKNILSCIAVLLLFVQATFCKTYTVHNEDEFKAAAAQVVAGDVINIANGTYNAWAVTLSVKGTAQQPIVVNAETPGKVIFTGNVIQPLFLITGNYNLINGINFTNCHVDKVHGTSGLLIELRNTKYARVTNCTFENNSAKVQFMSLVMVSGNGEYNQVDHCTFTGNIDNQDLQVKITKDATPANTLINDNLFKDKKRVSWKVFNGGECIQIGQDPVLLGTNVARSVIRNNRFLRCDGEAEVVSNKSSGNSYINNYFEDCHGELVMRGGHDCVIDSNRFKGGSGGIRINGTGHLISNNNISDVKTGIRLMYGMAKGKTEIGFYVAAANCLIRNNIIGNAGTGILVGDSKDEDWTGKFDTTKYPSRVMQDVAPADNVFKDNKFINTTTNIAYQ